MQLKKPDSNESKSNGYPANTNASSYGDDVVKKKIITYGVLTGVVGAAAIGSWVWYHGAHLPTKTDQIVKEAPQQMQLAPPPKMEQRVMPPPEMHPMAQPPPPKVAEEVDNLDEPVVNKSFAPPKPMQDENPTTSNKNLVHDEVNPLVYQYNAINSGPEIYAPAGATIEVSRRVNFRTIYVRGKTDKSGEFRITNPPPGMIYWRVKGLDDVHKISISAPESTNLELTIPATVNLGDSIAWKSNANASFYKIEISNDINFSGTVRTFSTKESSMNTALIGAGIWFVRLAALNLQSGSFDYSQITPMTVQGQTQDSQSTAPVQSSTPTQPDASGNQMNENQTQPIIIPQQTDTSTVQPVTSIQPTPPSN